MDGIARRQYRANDVLLQCFLLAQLLKHKRRSPKHAVERNFLIGCLGGVKGCRFPIVQLLQMDDQSKAAVQRVFFLQQILHHTDL